MISIGTPMKEYMALEWGSPRVNDRPKTWAQKGPSPVAFTAKGLPSGRRGTCCVLAAVEPRAGRRRVEVHRHRGKRGYASF